ncbi:hypothetical protein N1851_016943 [Merluccius polli]|uniref:Uncharacterized protein n=1 Tax=Merluccius polli TaxID=89951 RepID=A0AA47MQG0_MERPO|nr:hypothetical protein N1851_016943 [Merluccius polli]
MIPHLLLEHGALGSWSPGRGAAGLGCSRLDPGEASGRRLPVAVAALPPRSSAGRRCRSGGAGAGVAVLCRGWWLQCSFGQPFCVPSWSEEFSSYYYYYYYYSLSKQQQPARHSIAFIKAGERPQHRQRQVGGLLTTARDWQLKVDLGRQLTVPHTIAVTTLRPDLVLLSESTRQVVLLELTVPWEDRMEEVFERKRAKYEELVRECRRNSWKTRCNPIEVGCRGFAGQSLCRALRLLGIRGLHNKKAIKNITDVAEKASRWLWIKRGDTWATQAI